jgi:glycosyltransferase involved in cell wall biosynthesis
MQISLITPTGGRKYAFKLCEKYISRQTYKNIQWIVVDDGESPIKVNFNQEYIRSNLIWKPGINTQAYNLLLGLEKVKNDILFFIEDDDWYHSNYIENFLNFIITKKDAHIIGEEDSLNYNILTKEYFLYEMKNMTSLYKTCVTKEVYPFLEKVLIYCHENNIKYNNKHIYIDQILWRSKDFNKYLIKNKNLAIGIKSMLGRKGVCNHLNTYKNHSKYLNSALAGKDDNFNFLKSIINDDCKNYLNL